MSNSVLSTAILSIQLLREVTEAFDSVSLSSNDGSDDDNDDDGNDGEEEWICNASYSLLRGMVPINDD